MKRSGLLALLMAMAVGLAGSSVRAVGSRPAAETKPRAPMAFDEAPASGIRATCPVAKAEFTVYDGAARSEYKGKHYVFCCPECKEPFDQDPERYVGATASPAHSAATRTEF